MIYLIDTVMCERVEINIGVCNLIFCLMKGFDGEVTINLNVML